MNEFSFVSPEKDHTAVKVSRKLHGKLKIVPGRYTGVSLKSWGNQQHTG
jgi:hypothetical protein